MSTTIDGSASVTINSGAVLGITSGTAVASTSGTSIDFTGIPSWVKRITVMFSGVSTSGASNYLIQLGSGSVQTTGYVSTPIYVNASALGSTVTSTAGIFFVSIGATATFYGNVIFTLVGSNSWVASGNVTEGSATACHTSGGVTLSGTLDRVRITTVNGTDTFDAGSINILYE